MINLKNFEDWIDSKIVTRGYQYFDNGYVVSIEQKEDHVFEAQVDGSARYNVTVELDDQNNIGDSYCDCPYDMGDYCKHQVAVFLAIRNLYDNRAFIKKCRTPKQEKMRSLDNILSERSKEELVEYLLEIASENDEIRNRIRYDFDTADDQNNISQSVKLIRSYIKKSSDRHGFVAYSHTAEATRGAYLVIEKARSALIRNKTEHALDLLICVLHEMMDLLEGCDDSDGDVGGKIEYSLSTISEIIGRKSYSQIIKDNIFKKLLEEASSKRYDGWTDWKMTLLEYCSSLADTPQRRDKLDQELLKMVKTSSEDSWSHIYLKEKINMIRYNMVLINEGDEAAQEFIMNNLEFSGFRKMAIEKAFERKDTDTVIRLAFDGEQIDIQRRGLVDGWKKYRYKAYQLAGQLGKQREVARYFINNGDFEFYLELKRTYAPEDWDKIYPGIIRDLEPGTHTYNGIYPRILIEENEMMKLLHYAQRIPPAIEIYAKYLIADYQQDVFELFAIYIEQSASRASTRSGYQGVCRIIRKLQEFGGIEKAQEIKEKLYQKYKNKPAFKDELNRI